MKTFIYKLFISARKPSKHALQQDHTIISSVFLRKEKKLESWSQEGLQFEVTLSSLESQRSDSKTLFKKSTLKDPQSHVMLKIQKQLPHI